MVRARRSRDLHAERLARAKPVQRQRFELAQKRIRNVLRAHTIANHRTLEQKISDAGPFNQRVNPHVLTTAFEIMRRAGELVDHSHKNGAWLYLADSPPKIVAERLDEQLVVWDELQKERLSKRIGQALEITVYRALLTQSTLSHVGGFTDLDDHDDTQLYSKEDPSLINGRRMPGKKRVDFVISYGPARWAAIEVKNTREWLYPSHSDVRDLLAKALAVDAVPVLIGRRIPFVTFRVLSPCGLVIHQTYNQRYPASEITLAAKAKAKTLLGYHDIRLGNEPDVRLLKFVHDNLPRVLPAARDRFEAFRDLLTQYASGDKSYAEFAARVRRRQQGTNEDSDKPAIDELDIEDDI
jgi:hypothetical protein